jgi:hypothetical protein
MLKKLLIFSILFLLYFSLKSQVKTPQSSNQTSNYLAREEFKKFWRVFINAVKIRDTIQISRFINNQIEVDGFLDEDPQFILKGKKRFVSIFNAYSQYDGCSDERNEKKVDCDIYYNSEFIIQKEYLDNQKYQQIANYCFQLDKSGKWHLYLVYEDTTKYKKRAKKIEVGIEISK